MRYTASVKIVSTASARPNFVKLAAVHHALAAHGGFDHVIVHTGQHYDPLFSDIFFDQLSIPVPAHNLGVKGGTDAEHVIDLTMHAMLPVLEKEKPAFLLAYGDVNGAVGAVRAAKKLGIKVGHVEAGLRSLDRTMPEEVNRLEIDAKSDVLFVTEQSALDHLANEGVVGEIHFVGNTMIDTLIRMMPAIDALPIPGYKKPFAICTLHRPSNVDTKESLKTNLEFLREIGEFLPIVLPAHHRLLASLKKFGFLAEDGTTLRSPYAKHITLSAPLGYLHFLRLVKDASFVLTDSGGIQEEAAFLGKKCFTLRKNTERPSTVLSGSNTLIDLENDADRAAVLKFAKHPKDPAVLIPELWNGKAGATIAKHLLKIIG